MTPWGQANEPRQTLHKPQIKEKQNKQLYLPKEGDHNARQDLKNTSHHLYNIDPHKPHFYNVIQGFTGVNIIFLFLLQNINCGYSLEPPRRGGSGGSNGYPQSMFWAEIWKISEFFLSEDFQFLGVKFSIYLNRRIFVMRNNKTENRNVKSPTANNSRATK